MNIKQAAEQSGVSARNIRYYEQAGLLTPARNPENEYRIYSQADVRALKLIRMLRTLDMPVEEIGTVLNGTLPLAEAAERQRQRLEAEQQKLAAAAAFCTELAVGDRTAAELDVDSCLERMDSPAPAGGWFTGWVQDYRKMAAAEHKRQFTFTPDTAIATPQEFTAELLAWAARLRRGDRHHPREHGAAVYAGRHRVQGRAVFESCAQYPDPAGAVRGVRSIGAGGGE